MPIRLVVKSKAQTGDQAPQENVLDAERVVVGRDPACEVVLAEPVVSRRHLSIVREGALYFIEDLGSSFGTRVNGVALPASEKRLLCNGDVIAVGPYDLTFDRIADPVAPGEEGEQTSFVAKRVIKDVLRNLSLGEGPTLRVMNGPLEGRRFGLYQAQELVVGREAGVDILLDDDLVSRRHAQFRRDWTGCHVEDLGSRNGVRVNRKRVETHPLKDRDEVEIGSVRLLFLDPAEVREAPVVPAEPAAPPASASSACKAPAARASAARGLSPGDGKPVPDSTPEPGLTPKPAPEPAPEAKPAAKPEAKPAAPPEPQAPEENEESEQAEGASSDEPEAGFDDSEPPPSAEELAQRSGALPRSQAPSGEPRGKPTGREIVRSLVPILIVVGVAIFAVAILAVTFFVM